MVGFKKVRTNDPDIDRLQQNIAAAFASIPALPTFQAASVVKDYTATGFEGVIHVDAARGPIRVTLPAPSNLLPPLTIKQVNATGKPGAVTVVAADGSKTIAGASSFALDDSGTGSVTFTSDGIQHWPSAGAGGNPPSSPAPAPLAYVGKAPIQVIGNIISFTGSTPGPTPAPVSPWVAPVSTGGGLEGDKTGTETWQAEWPIDFSGAPPNISLYWWFQALSSAGSGTFRVRIGGSAYRALDGAVAGTWSEPNATLTPRSLVIPVTSPVGVQRVTVTAQASAAGALAQIEGANLLFR